MSFTFYEEAVRQFEGLLGALDGHLELEVIERHFWLNFEIDMFCLLF